MLGESKVHSLCYSFRWDFNWQEDLVGGKLGTSEAGLLGISAGRRLVGPQRYRGGRLQLCPCLLPEKQSPRALWYQAAALPAGASPALWAQADGGRGRSGTWWWGGTGGEGEAMLG